MRGSKRSSLRCWSAWPMGYVSLFLAIGLACAAAWFAHATNSVQQAMTTDSDGDGMSDWEESVVGTNPEDPSNVLAFITCTIQHGDAVLGWQSRSGAVYEVVCAERLDDLQTNAQRVAYVQAAGGSAPWYRTSSQVTSTLSAGVKFYSVRFIVNAEAENATADMSDFE